MPVYNVEKYIAKAIQSVLNQTFQDFELLIIIDGSPDNSIEVARSFKDERINIYEKKNGGLSDARNFGLNLAKGEFILFLDSDDWIEPDLIEDNRQFLIKEKANIVVFGYYQDDENLNGDLIRSKRYAPSVESYSLNEQNKIDFHHLGILGYAWNKLYRRSFLEENNLVFEKGTSLIEDILFNIQVYLKVELIIFNTNCYYHYINREIATLTKVFYKDVYSLKKRRAMALIPFFKRFNVDRWETLVAASHIRGIRYVIYNLFSFKNGLSLFEKQQYIDGMFTDPFTITYVEEFLPTSINDKIYKFLIKNKLSFVTLLLSLIKK